MSDKDTKNPFEEIQKQLQELLKTSNPNVTISPFVPAQQTPPPSYGSAEESAEQDEVLKRIRAFNRKPKEIRDYLDRYVIRQDEAKKVLSVAICDHYNHVRQCIEEPRLSEKEYSKQNILLLGPTGVGKTYLMRNIAKLIGVPFVKADATKFSETGYVGNDVEDLVRDLYKVANNNADLAQYGIIYIDEIDKIAGNASNGGKDVSGRGVQINLLKLMEEADVNLFSPNDMMSQMQAMMSMGRDSKKQKRTLSTKNILFIVSGAFDKLAENVRKRLDQGQIGFSSKRKEEEINDSHFLNLTETRDFIDYGFEPEFIGRLPVRVACESLSADDLGQILKNSEGSILDQYHRDFKGYNIDFSITDGAINEIADRAAREKTGARGLMTVLEKTFRDFKFELSSTLINNFDVDAETIKDPRKALTELLNDNEGSQNEFLLKRVEEFKTHFQDMHGLELTFTEEACSKIVDLAIEADRSTNSICEQLFKDYEHGLKIVNRNSAQSTFLITAEAVEDPDGELSKWVVESIKGKDEPEPESKEGGENKN
ncbi:MAG: AAA family ATPase [Verrucomicrobia bacterium]|nr:AAA family ATPase [Verrucomicrobiota bacterium]MDA1067948.1 AAA family ATPase [Verrucomicrobiota bacterium]